MYGFFKGWRRKIGCVTLVIALTFTGGWIRSRGNVDAIWVYGTNPNFVFLSGGEQFLILRGNGFTIVEHTRNDTYNISLVPEKLPLPSGWVFAFTCPETKLNVNSELREKPEALNLIPYWSITIPLTLVSACLLLTQPRKSTPKTIGNEGATS